MQYVPASRTPVKIDGDAAGSTTLRNTNSRDAPIERAESINSRSTCLTPPIVLSSTGQNDAQKMIATFEDLADTQEQDEHREQREGRGLPEQLQNRIDNRLEAAEPAHQQARASRRAPMASGQAHSERWRLASRCFHSAPLPISCQMAPGICEGGLR